MPFNGTPTAAPKVSVLVAQQCIALGKSRGMPVETLLAEAGINAEQIVDSKDWLPLSAIGRLLHFSLKHINDPLFGLHSAPQINMAMIGVLGYVLQTSSTLQGLIESAMRYERLLSDTGTTSLQHEPGAALWRWQGGIENPLISRHLTECILGCNTGLLRLLLQNQPWPLLAVRFQHAAPDDKNLLRDYERFFSCPVYFQQADSELVLSPQALSQPLLLANPDLHQTLEQHAQALLNQRNSAPGFIDQVKVILRTQLLQGTSPLREQVATLMGMSGRSLHRRLQELGSSYREVFDELRFDLARDALRDSARSVEMVAQQLGFQESQSFIRWFRQMAGSTPGEFRQQNVDV